MTRQFRAELTKVFSLRLTWGLVLIAGCYVGINAVLLGVLTGRDELAGSDIGLSATEAANAVYGQTLSAYIFALVAGIMVITGEFRHGTAATTFMIQPPDGSIFHGKCLNQYTTEYRIVVIGPRQPNRFVLKELQDTFKFVFHVGGSIAQSPNKKKD